MAGPQETPPIKVKDKMTAFALATYHIDQKDYDIESFDYTGGRISTAYLLYNTGIMGTMKLRAKLVFTLMPDNVFEVKFVNVQEFDTKYSADGKRIIGYYWKDNKYMASEFIPIRNKIVADIDSMQSDPAAVEKCMDRFLGSFRYSYVVLKSLTEVGRARFIQEHYVNRVFEWKLPLVDFQYNKNEKYDKKYVALFQYNVAGDEKAFGKLFSNTIHMNVYTDDDALAEYAKREPVEYSGVLVSIDETFVSDNFNFDFFTRDGR
jgi:hypothetical protein